MYSNTNPLIYKKGRSIRNCEGEDKNNLYGKHYKDSVLKEYQTLLKNTNISKNTLLYIASPTQKDFELKTARERLMEFQELKKQIDLNQETKNSFKFLGKRERILKNAWKNGVMGYDLPHGKFFLTICRNYQKE